jgi:hypothetical protein
MFPAEWSIRRLLRQRRPLVQELVRIGNERDEEDRQQSPHRCFATAYVFLISASLLYLSNVHIRVYAASIFTLLPKAQ